MLPFLFTGTFPELAGKGERAENIWWQNVEVPQQYQTHSRQLEVLPLKQFCAVLLPWAGFSILLGQNFPMNLIWKPTATGFSFNSCTVQFKTENVMTWNKILRLSSKTQVYTQIYLASGDENCCKMSPFQQQIWAKISSLACRTSGKVFTSH